MSKLKAISLFAGVGGICKGFQNNNVDIVYSNDFDKFACETYRNNFDHGIVEEDLLNVDSKTIPDAEILLGGSPCQSFSIAGYRKGFNDDRGNLFFEYLRILIEKKPEVFLFENVKNLITHDKGKTFKIISDAFGANGYYIDYKVINTCEYGNLPQNRERIYIVGFLDYSKYTSFYFPEPIPLTKKLSDIIDFSEKKDDRYYYHNSKYYEEMLKGNVVRQDTVYQIRRIYLRENKNGLCPTLTANMGTGGHNVPIILDDHGIRKLTPRECFKFQGFDDSFILPSNLSNGQLYKQAGNSVSVPVIDRIAKNIVSCF